MGAKFIVALQFHRRAFGIGFALVKSPPGVPDTLLLGIELAFWTLYVGIAAANE